MNYFVTAIGTDSGKTVVSALLGMALNADYWKPVQAGFPTDTERIKQLTNNTIHCHTERYALNTPASPHAAAPIDNVNIKLDDFELPQTNNPLVIEGAGGIMVPLNMKDLVIDLAVRFNTPIVLVSNNYLGSINHTLLSLDYLKDNKLPIAGIIFNGPSNPSTEEVILSKTEAPCLFKIPQLDTINFQVLQKEALKLKTAWYDVVG
ncbi:MAG: dethiobiotin synthase [Fulvivirga sp.]